MNKRRHLFITAICVVSLFILIACSSVDENETEEPVEATATVVVEEATPEIILDRDAACPAQVITAMTEVDTICSGAEGNQVCYGNVRLAAIPQDDAEPFTFEAPGDIVDLNRVQSLSLSSDLVANEWGVALMRLQANIADSLPGQYVTFVLFGNAQLEPSVEVAEGGLQSFYFRSGIGDAPCAEAPDSGILAQTPEGVTSVQFLINNVDITLGSTAFLQAENGQTMTVSVLEGEATVTSFSERRTVPAGLQTVIELDDEGQAAGPPSDPKPYNGAQFVKLPIANLQRPVRIANSVATGEFTAGTENWQTAHGGSAVIFAPADETSNGAICADDGTGAESDIPWYFDAPRILLGDHAGAYGGELVFALRQSAVDILMEDDEETVRIIGGDNLLLKYFADRSSGTDWTTFHVPLVEGAGWINGATNQAATAEELQAVLGAMTLLRIRGEYRIGEDRGCMDYVRIIGGIVPQFVDEADIVTAVASVESFVGSEQAFTIGERVVGEIGEAGEIDVYTFGVEAGQNVYFSARGIESGSILWTVESPSGAVIFENMGLWIDNDPGFLTLADGGDYTIRVFGDGADTGVYSFQTWLDRAPQYFAYELGVPVSDDGLGDASGNIEQANDVDIYSFVAPENGDYYFAALGEDGAIEWRLEDATGEVLFIAEGLWLGNDPGAFALEGGVEYTIIVNGVDGDYGAYDFMAYLIPEAQSFEYTIGDVVSTETMGEGQGELEVPGAVDIYTFTPEETDAYFFASLSVSDNNAPQWKATDANGETLFEGAGLWLGGHPGEMTLDAGMTYTITVYAAHGAYGEYAFQVWRVPEPDVIAPIAVGDSVFAEMNDPDDGAGNIEAPGAVDRYTLQVRRAQSVTFLAVEGSDEGSLTWTVVAPDGTPVFENEGLWSGNELGPFRLTQGDYTIYVGGENGATGTYRFDVRGG